VIKYRLNTRAHANTHTFMFSMKMVSTIRNMSL